MGQKSVPRKADDSDFSYHSTPNNAPKNNMPNDAPNNTINTTSKILYAIFFSISIKGIINPTTRSIKRNLHSLAVCIDRLNNRISLFTITINTFKL
jgi:hypothetical protein